MLWLDHVTARTAEPTYHVGHIESTEDIHSGYGFAIGNVAAFDMGPVLKQGVMRKLRCLNMDHQMRMCVCA